MVSFVGMSFTTNCKSVFRTEKIVVRVLLQTNNRGQKDQALDQQLLSRVLPRTARLSLYCLEIICTYWFT